MPAPKKGTLKNLIGKEVRVLGRYESKVNGPFTVLALDMNFICLCRADKKPLWFNLDHITCIEEGGDA